MIINITKKNIISFMGKWMFIIFIIFTIYLIPIAQSSKFEGLTYFEFILLTLTDHYYILFAMLISYIFFILKNLKNDEQEILIRSKKYFRYFLAEVISLIAISAVYVLLHLLVALILGYGLRFENVFSPNPSSDVLAHLNMFFSSPLIGMISIVFYLIFGLAFLGTIIVFCNHYFKTKTVVVIVVLLYLLTMINLQLDNRSIFPFIFIDNYLILHHAIAVYGKQFYLILLSGALILSLIFIIIKYWWHKEVRHNGRIRSGIYKLYLSMLLRNRNLLIMIGSILVIVIAILLRNDKITFNDLLIIQFYGHGIGYFDMIQFLTMLLYNGVPVYILCTFLEKDSIERGTLLTIRLKSKVRWMNGMLRAVFFFILSYVLLSFAVTAILSLLSSVDFSGYCYMLDLFANYGVGAVPTYYLYWIIVSSKCAELMLYFMIIFIIYSYTKKVTAGFIVLQLSYFVYFFSSAIVMFLPIGIASLSRIREFSNTGLYYWQVMIVLILTNTILYILSRYIGLKKIFE